MTTYYRGPTNDNYGYDRDYLTTSELPFGSEDPWETMEGLEWIPVEDLSEGDTIVNSYYLNELYRGGEEDWENEAEIYVKC